MAKGRPRKTGKRETNGRLQRPTIAQLEQLERARQNREKSVVLAQPHRRGDTDQKCASALGRFCKRHKLRDELFNAGENYANLMRRWRSARGIPTQERLGIGKGGEGPSDETVHRWAEEIGSYRIAMAHAGGFALFEVERLALDDKDVMPGNDLDGINGLVALAIEMKLMRPSEFLRAC